MAFCLVKVKLTGCEELVDSVKVCVVWLLVPPACQLNVSDDALRVT